MLNVQNRSMGNGFDVYYSNTCPQIRLLTCFRFKMPVLRSEKDAKICFDARKSPNKTTPKVTKYAVFKIID